MCNENSIPTGGSTSAAKMRSELIKALFPVDDDDGDEGDDDGDDDEEDGEEPPMSEAARRRRDVLRIYSLKISQLKKELDDAGVKFDKSLKKADLQELLLQHHGCTLEDATTNGSGNAKGAGSRSVVGSTVNNGSSTPARPRSGHSMAARKSPYKDAIMSPAASRSAPQDVATANTSVSRAGRTTCSGRNRKKTAKALQHEEEYRNDLSSPGIAKKRGRKKR